MYTMPHLSLSFTLMRWLVYWLLSRTLFGPREKIIEQHTTAWCLATMIVLIGPIQVPDDPKYKPELELAQKLAMYGYEEPKTGELKPYIALGSLRYELEQSSRDVCSEACIEFLEYLLVINPKMRPTAEQALQHPFIWSMS